MYKTDWKFQSGQKRHTQDGCQLVRLMKGIGKGNRLVYAIDVGCGDGIIAYDMLIHKKATKVLAIDIVSEAVKVAQQNLESYGEKAEAKKISASTFFKNKMNWDLFHRFVINPPFFVEGSGPVNKNKQDQLARHDSTLSLNLWARGAKRLLKTGGELYCVFPTERLAEALCVLSQNNVEPKELWWFKDDLRKRRFFLRAVRGARPGVIVHTEMK
ncbi:MAG: methyltransferase [Oligoflexia bacterium]|nr:methyltransferase [Oligoflexia bacterium]